MVDLEADDEAINLSSSSDTDVHLQHQSKRARSAGCIPSPKQKKPVQSYPASVSIDQLLKAGKLVKPVSKTKTVLNLESFDISQKEWVMDKSTTMFIDDARFAFGAFRDAFKARSESGVKWVVKKYNEKARNTIVVTLESSIEDHARKQVQMHTVARHLGKKFSSHSPKSFGE